MAHRMQIVSTSTNLCFTLRDDDTYTVVRAGSHESLLSAITSRGMSRQTIRDEFAHVRSTLARSAGRAMSRVMLRPRRIGVRLKRASLAADYCIHRHVRIGVA